MLLHQVIRRLCLLWVIDLRMSCPWLVIGRVHRMIASGNWAAVRSYLLRVIAARIWPVVISCLYSICWSCYWCRSISPLLVETLSSGPVHSYCCGVPVVHRGKLIAVPACCLVMRKLFGGWLHMVLMHNCLLLCIRPGRCATGSVKACAVIDGSIVDYAPVNIHIMHDGGIDIRNCRVISE